MRFIKAHIKIFLMKRLAIKSPSTGRFYRDMKATVKRDGTILWDSGMGFNVVDKVE